MKVQNERAAVQYATEMLRAFGSVTTGVTKLDDSTVSVWVGVRHTAEDSENLKDGEEI